MTPLALVSALCLTTALADDGVPVDDGAVDDRPLAIPWWGTEDPPPPPPDAPVPPGEPIEPVQPIGPTEVEAAQVQAAPRLPGPIDRRRRLAVGARFGSLIGGYRGADEEAVYDDTSFGLTTRYRITAPIAVELSAESARQSWAGGTTRSQWIAQASVLVFFAPYRRFQPYLIGGLTLDRYRLDDDIGVAGKTVWVQDRGVAFGPHAGLGFEVALGHHLALDSEVRAITYVNLRDKWQAPVQAQITFGVVAYF